ncbi:MAG: hypothetical protein M3356_05480 [Actinomycetota bacterium]|nr:hypothetical protein [Actinomycetota bacterium]
MLVGLLGVGAAVYWPRVARGGFAWDDWEKAAEARFWSAFGPFDAREALYEPGLAALLPLPHLAFGDHPSLHLALACLLGVGMAFCVYLLLRELGIPVAIAAAISALSLLFPWSDSVRLWATASANQVSVSLLLIGATLALRGIAEPTSGGSPARRWSLAAYVLSMLSYPVTPVLVAASTLLYRLRVPWHQAWEWGRQDLAAAVAIGIYVRLATTKPVQSVGDQLDHAWTILEEWTTLLARAVMPFGDVAPGLVWGAAAAVAIAGLAALLRRRDVDCASDDRLTVGLALIAAGVAASLLAYLIFVPGDAKYRPLAPGLYNRVGIVAGPGVAALVAGLAVTGVALLLRGGASRLAIDLAAAVVVAGIGLGWAGQVRDDVALWNRATIESERVLATLNDPRLGIPDAAVALTVGHPHRVSPGVPVFGASFDLDAAMALRRGRQALQAHPLDVPLACGPRRAVPVDSAIHGLPSPAYGAIRIVDVERRRVWQVRSRADCERLRSPIAARIRPEASPAGR